jgi:F5/8 type C domain
MSSIAHLDFFSDLNAWSVVASGQATGELNTASGSNHRAGLRLDFDFHGGGGFVVVRRAVEFSLPETFEIKFEIRGSGLANHLEFKVTDPSTTNVWRHLRQNFELPAIWTDLKIRERDLPFAWGPAGGGAASMISAIEVVIAAGPGGKGSIELSNFLLEDQSLNQAFVASASSQRFNQPASAVFDAGSPSGWRADEADAKPFWSVDFGQHRRFGGLVLTWPSALPPRAFSIDVSNDQASWHMLHRAHQASGLKSYIPTAAAEARWLRVNFTESATAALVRLELKPDAFSQTPNEFIHALAADFPRGWFPRYWYREQSYWTSVGSPHGKRRALINEEGLVEVDEGGFSLEPFLRIGERLVTWADAITQVTLPADGTPLPAATWDMDGVKLFVQPWIDGTAETLTLRIHYRLEITPEIQQPIQLVVAVRPFQVNPPWQAFRNLGGRSAITHIGCHESGFCIGSRVIHADRPPHQHGAARFEEGGVMAFLVAGLMPSRTELEDDSELGSAAMAWDLTAKQRSFEVTLSIPFFKVAENLTTESFAIATAHWQQTLATVKWDIPNNAAAAFACFRTAAAHILINRDGPAIQPGPRRYTRSWIRDCVIMGAALAKAGLTHGLRDFLVWYVQFQREDGSIPCVIDRDGVDDLVEHDSHGQFLWGIREVFRAEGDLEFLISMSAPIQRAADFLCQLRRQRMTDFYRQPAQLACFGLLPESASHEGYLAHPVHSYWDDFWGIRGLGAAAEMAALLGRKDAATRWQSQANDFLKAIQSSLNCVIATRKIDYIPGSVEWADFDPTATANAIGMLDFADDLPTGPLENMLETYLTGFRQRREGKISWSNYSAYEIRIIGAFVRLGRREEAHELLDFFLSDRRPLSWNQWPEISWRDPQAPGHLGDVPHTWIAAEYLLALASMVASERDSSASMVLASGLSWTWISQQKPFKVNGLPSRYGKLDFSIHAQTSQQVQLTIGCGISLPPGGLTIAPPLPYGQCILAVSAGLTLSSDGRYTTVTTLPLSATLTIGPIKSSTFAVS